MKVLICVDVQNDFITGVLGDKKNERIARDIARYASKVARAKGYQIYATCDTHSPDDYKDTIEGKKLPIHCVPETEGHKIFEGLVKDEYRQTIIPQGHIFDKDSFISYHLIRDIADASRNVEEIEEIELCGFCTGICVLGNAIALRSYFPRTKISILSDICGDLSYEEHDMAMKVMKRHFIEEKSAFADSGH